MEDLGFTIDTTEDDLGYTLPAKLHGIPSQPNGTDAVLMLLGDFATHPCEKGVVKLPEPVAGIGEIRCHVLLVPVFEAFVRLIHKDGHWSLMKTIYGYLQSVRPGSVYYKGTSRIALSSWGASLTINRGYNPYDGERRSRPTGDPRELTSKDQPGYSFYPNHPIVKIAEQCGLTWCGATHWKNADTKAECTPITHPDPATFIYAKIW